MAPFEDDSSEGYPPAERIRDGRIWACCDADDDEHRKFLNAVWRIVAKLTTKEFDLYQRDGTPRREEKESTTWIGHHAMEWAAKDPRRWIEGNIRPPGRASSGAAQK